MRDSVLQPLPYQFLHAGCFVSENFCASFDATCDGNAGRFGSTAECVAVYNSLAAGDAGAASGASEACLKCNRVCIVPIFCAVPPPPLCAGAPWVQWRATAS